MINIRDHGGIFGSGNKEITTARLLGSKTFRNPFSTELLYAELLDDDNIEIFTSTLSKGNKKVRFSDLSISDITSKNTYLNTRKLMFVQFNDYYIELANGVNYIKIYDKNKNLIKQINLGNTNFSNMPRAAVAYGGDFVVITCQTNSYYGTYVVYKLYKDLTTLVGPLSLPNFVYKWFPTNSALIAIYDSKLYICNATTGAIISQTSVGQSQSIVGSFFDIDSYLVADSRDNVNSETLSIWKFTGSTYVVTEQASGRLDSNAAVTAAQQPDYVMYMENKREQSIFYMSTTSPTIKKFKLNKNDKVVFLHSNSGKIFPISYQVPVIAANTTYSKIFFVIHPSNIDRIQYTIYKFTLE